ncbi:hypothetical protein HDC94_000545 [Leifsonia sp. AK011]|uniref:hypothetical protein n=1 Tax=Leifsonia sp. AK011 TaxID=2723075 RepID=UPI0015C82D7B|nr:hypothetical protein [Leifsonia sp. AK011]NYF09389.1 hypothetical protein [Leifsonia sp. AK011]
MNTNTEKTNTDKTQRPGFWLRAIEYRKHQLGREQRRAFRDSLADKARDGVSDEDYATTMATLEKMARNLGWRAGAQEQSPFLGFAATPAPHSVSECGQHGYEGRGHRGHGFGPRGFRGRGFGPDFDHDHHEGSKDLPSDKA